MGSAAFLNEAVNQLAETYLQLKQQELGQRIPHEDYPRELQKVRMFIADRNFYGVDLNPVAVELAEVSLWLNAIYGEDQTDASGLPKPAHVPGSVTSSLLETASSAPAGGLFTEMWSMGQIQFGIKPNP